MKKRFVAPTIREIGDYIKEKGYKYVNAEVFFCHYASKGWLVGKTPMKDWHQALAGWEAREKAKRSGQQATKLKLLPIIGKICSVGDCRLPAVYKDTSGSYDHYRCAKHLPTEVKEMYE